MYRLSILFAFLLSSVVQAQSTLPDSLISETAVTQHQGALSVTEAQISNLSHTVDTTLDEAAVDGFVANNGYLTSEVDGDIENEIQNLSLVGDDLTLSGDLTPVDLTPYLPLNEGQVDAFVADNGYLTSEVDGSTSNELQALSLNANTLSLSLDAATVDLSPYLDDTTLDEAAVDAFVANNGYLTAEVDGSTSNEIQDLDLTGNTLSLTLDGTTVDLSGYLDDTTLSDSDVETAYNNQVAVVSQGDAEAGTSSTVYRWTPERVSQAITALAGGGGGGWADMTEAVWSGGTQSEVTDGASSVAFSFDTDNAFSTGKLLTLSNNGTQAFSIDDEGSLEVNTNIAIAKGSSNSAWFVNTVNANVFSYIGARRGVWVGAEVTSVNDTSLFDYMLVTDNVGYKGSNTTLVVGSTGEILIQNLPTSDPGVAGQLWNDSGTLKISGG